MALENNHPPPAADLFKPKSIFMAGAGFIAAVALANRIVRFIHQRGVNFDCPPFWPISIFLPRLPDGLGALTALGVLLIFLLSLLWLTRAKYRLGPVLLTGLVLVLGTNLVHGFEFGLVIPISGCGEHCTQYYHDAVKIKDALDFLTRFEQIQPGLLVHSRTHPPGAALFLYLLIKLFSDPGLIALVIAVSAVILSAVFFYPLCREEFGDRETAGYLTWLLILVPAVQIYDAASLDAVIAGLLTAGLYFVRHPKPALGILGSVLFIWLASFLTFGAVFIFPVMAGYELLRCKSLRRSAVVLLVLCTVYLIMDWVFHFNYLNSFRIASLLENPQGFRGFSEPASYFFTRLEGISEILVFFGPFLGLLMIQGLRIMKMDRLNLLALTWLALGTLLAIFATGAFRTGETARACLFIYPYLLFPVACCLRHYQTATREKNLLLCLVFLQSLFMQLFGFYFW